MMLDINIYRLDKTGRTKQEKKKFLLLLFSLLIITTLIFLSNCYKLPYIAGEGDIIYLSLSPSAINQGETATIKISGEKANGYPLPDGTIVHLHANTGDIQNQVELLEGKAQVTCNPGADFYGEVIITARCGNAQIEPEELKLTVNQIQEIDIKYLYITANPMELPYEGGQSDITVKAYCEEMKPVAGKSLVISTDNGNLYGNGFYQTDKNGTVQTTLTTQGETTVTAKYKDITASITIKAGEQNNNPNASFVYSPTNPESGEKVYFNADGSSDDDGHIIRYHWNFGDGKTASGKAVNHTYEVTEAKTFNVTLKVTDNRGGTDSTSQTVTITYDSGDKR